MAKKPKDETPNANSVPNKDIIQRLNFLYQAGVYLNGVTSQSPPRRKRVTTSDLSRSYVSSMKIVGQKTVVKMCASLGHLCVESDGAEGIHPSSERSAKGAIRFSFQDLRLQYERRVRTYSSLQCCIAE